MDTRCEIEGFGDSNHSASTNSENGDHRIVIDMRPAPETESDDEYQTATGTIERERMCSAASYGNWETASPLLKQYPDLGRRKLNKEGDRALHLAVRAKQTEFVQNLINVVEEDVLQLNDGHGYTACHYAAMAGVVDIARILMLIDPTLLNKRNKYGATPFPLAISYGNAAVVLYFLKVTESIPLKLEEVEWFNLLVLAITSKMFDVASKILERVKIMALMKDKDNRTALHVLAQQDLSRGGGDSLSLAWSLWGEILKYLGRKEVLELMQNPPLLHDAAKVGNLYLIDIITAHYPDLISHIDKHGYSIFHIVVTHRHEDTLALVKKARDVKNFSALSRDEYDGNNFLHSAAKSIGPKGLEIVGEQDVHMRKAFAWFKKVEAVAPPMYSEMRNKDGYTPIELFWKEHAELLAKSHEYMKSTAESCMLISTIVITLVFAAAFAPPGGLNQDTGIPTLLKKKWFTSFVVFQVLALSSSTLSIIGFWSITSSNYEQSKFFVLSHYLRLSMCALLLSVFFIVSAFLSAFFLVFVDERKVLVLSFMLPLYVALVVLIFYQIFKVLRKTYRLWNESSNKIKIMRWKIRRESKRLWRQAFRC